MRIFAVIMLILFSNVASSMVTIRPNQKASSISKMEFGWITSFDTNCIETYVTDDCKQFMSNDDVMRYFKLKMKNFVNNLILQVDLNLPQRNYNYYIIEVEVYKYNETSQIFQGLISLQVHPSLNLTGKPLSYVKVIGGSNTQIVGDIKSSIDIIVEKFAEDYFYIKDLK